MTARSGISHNDTSAYATDDAKWKAVADRDPNADGRFYYAVRTTGVFCIPSCPAPRARRGNVVFYNTIEAATKAGFRQCKRCWPNGPDLAAAHAAAVARACRMIETAEANPTLEALAKTVGMSRFHFHRVFKAQTGLTPKGYAGAHRSRKIREQLAQCATVTDAIYHAGFNSSGRFYATAEATLGMRPAAFRDHGHGARIRFAVGECSLGSVLVAASQKGVCAILLGDDADALVRDLQDRFSRSELIGGDGDFEATVAKVIALIEAPKTGCQLPLDVRGTAFQARVWQALTEIAAGSTMSYAAVAERIGAPSAVRAVARACAANPIAVAIPCHRVVRRNGALSGYRWGVERKHALLQRERS